jgi:hypothetical protein
MKISYSFTVLRYMHDVVTGEFVNVGVVLYAPKARYLSSSCTSRYGRLSDMFYNVNGDYYKKIVGYIEDKLVKDGERLISELPFEKLPKSVLEFGVKVLPVDDSSLQFSPEGFGITENPEITIKDQTGTGARVRVLTSGLDPTTGRYPVTGVELLESGTGYTEVTDWSLNNTFVDDYIQLVHFPSNFYNDPTQLVPGKRYRIKAQITSDELASNVNVEQITKFAVLSTGWLG